jgi:hypothetical protein
MTIKNMQLQLWMNNLHLMTSFLLGWRLCIVFTITYYEMNIEILVTWSQILNITSIGLMLNAHICFAIIANLCFHFLLNKNSSVLLIITSINDLF